MEPKFSATVAKMILKKASVLLELTFWLIMFGLGQSKNMRESPTTLDHLQTKTKMVPNENRIKSNPRIIFGSEPDRESHPSMVAIFFKSCFSRCTNGGNV